MAAKVTHFMLITNAEKIKSVLDLIPSWQNIFVKTSKGSFSVKSVTLTGSDVQIEFLDQSPEASAGSLYFSIGDLCYYLDGDLKKDSVYKFAYQNLNQEQKRRTPRMSVPGDYPATFSLEKLNGHEASEQAKVTDIHGSGLQLYLQLSIPVKNGDQIVGTLRINKFPEIKLSGVVRHQVEKDGGSFTGVELNHREFGSENKLLELLAFYQHDVFYFNKKKAANG